MLSIDIKDFNINNVIINPQSQISFENNTYSCNTLLYKYDTYNIKPLNIVSNYINIFAGKYTLKTYDENIIYVYNLICDKMYNCENKDKHDDIDNKININLYLKNNTSLTLHATKSSGLENCIINRNNYDIIKTFYKYIIYIYNNYHGNFIINPIFVNNKLKFNIVKGEIKATATKIKSVLSLSIKHNDIVLEL